MVRPPSREGGSTPQRSGDGLRGVLCGVESGCSSSPTEKLGLPNFTIVGLTGRAIQEARSVTKLYAMVVQAPITRCPRGNGELAPGGRHEQLVTPQLGPAGALRNWRGDGGSATSNGLRRQPPPRHGIRQAVRGRGRTNATAAPCHRRGGAEPMRRTPHTRRRVRQRAQTGTPPVRLRPRLAVGHTRGAPLRLRRERR
jgi:hypothetical protein